MSSWPSWPFLVRPVWYLFDKIGDDRIAAVVFLGNPLILWPALIAVAICLRDWIVTRGARCIPGTGVLSRPLSRLGVAAANARLHLLLSAGGDHGEPRAGLCVDARNMPALAAMGLSLRSAVPASPRCCRYRPRSSARRWRRSTA